MRSEAFETLFGGAAGGGKSHGQLLDALRFAVVYPGSRQLMLRRTMPELERSLVPAALRLYPQSVASYKVSEHRWDFINGSTLEFGYCDAESDVTKYQSAEYDVIRFDELTHFTESQFTYLISRIRGANPYPKQVKSTTNPGGIGHQCDTAGGGAVDSEGGGSGCDAAQGLTLPLKMYFILFPDSTAPTACAFSLLASAHST